jgi:hypothetical protein
MNRHSVRISILALLAGILATGAALAQTTDRMDPIALKNWKVPSIETMLKTYGSTPSPDTHFVNPGAFVFQSTVPCRIVDTRQPVGAYGGPIFAAGATRTYSVADAVLGPLCSSSFPSFIAAVSLNITVASTAGTGFVTGYATGGSLPGVASITFIGAGVTLSNAAIVPTDGGVDSRINIFASQGTHVIIDINGFFIGNLSANADNLSITTGLGGGGAIVGTNTSSSTGSAGVLGRNTAASGVTNGVQGFITSTSSFSAGGLFEDGAGVASASVPTFSAGLIGHGRNGVIGRTSTSTGDGVAGVAETTAGVTTGFGIVGNAAHAFLAITGDYAGPSPSLTVNPHPTNASAVIAYPALTGNEAGTYFRGTAVTTDREFVINVPEDFRMVTDSEGLTVQLTPVGAAASMFVVSEDLGQIVVRSSRDVRFHYLVQGVRQGQKGFTALRSAIEHPVFLPQTPETLMQTSWPDYIKQRLIANGTYNEDGSINLQTAERIGLAQQWREADEQARAAAAKKAEARAQGH